MIVNPALARMEQPVSMESTHTHASVSKALPDTIAKQVRILSSKMI